MIPGHAPGQDKELKTMISGKILRDAIISGANNINNQRSRVAPAWTS